MISPDPETRDGYSEVFSLDLKISSEWAPLQVALFHDASNMIDRSPEGNMVDPNVLAKHPEQGPVRKEVVIEQHARFRLLLQDKGVRLISPVTQPDAFCQVYTRDPSFVVGDTLYIARMSAKYRQPETAGLTELRRQVAREVVLDRGVIEGGDVMVLSDDLVLVGTGEITDAEGFAALKSHLEGSGRTVIRVRHTALHLDCCLAPLPNHKCLYSGSRLPGSSLDLLRPLFSELLPLDPIEARNHLAANMLWLNSEEVASTTDSPDTNRLLRGMGYAVHEVEYGEVIHRWGSVHCTVGPLVRGPYAPSYAGFSGETQTS